MMKILAYIFIICICFFFSCNFERNKKLESINRIYTPETINYFYELAFHHDSFPKKCISLSKWSNDIYYFIEGDTLTGDKYNILNAVNQINSLQLPIKIHEVLSRDSANLFFVFTPGKNTRALGRAIKESSDDHVKSAKIEIHKESDYTINIGPNRRMTILHEMMHVLGLSGHSYTYLNSLLIKGFTSYTTELPEIDKQVIKLLYEPFFKAGYTCKRFNEDFASVLYHVSTSEKFYSYVKKEHVKKALLDTIFKYGLVKHNKYEECVAKFSSEVFIRVSGDYSADFIDQIQKTISEINNATEMLRLVYIKKDTLLPDVGIYYTFKKDSLIKYSIESTVKTKSYWDLLLPRVIQARIQIVYKNKHKMQMAIANSLFRAVCIETQESDFFTICNGDIHLKPIYKDILKVYYSASLYPGFTKSELAKIINKLP